MFTDENMQVSDMKYLSPLGKSDHSMVVFDFHCYIDYKEPKTSFKYSIADYEKNRKDTSWIGWLDNFDSIASNENTEAM